MIRFLALSAAALAASAGASAARAADSSMTPDLRCLVVAFAMTNTENPQVKNAGTLASLFYLGKLDGRISDADLEAGLKQEIGRMSPEDIKSEATRCGQQLQARGKTVIEIGARLQAAAPKAP